MTRDDVGPEERIEDQAIIGLLEIYEETVGTVATNYGLLTEQFGEDDTYDDARRHINLQDELKQPFYDPEDGYDKDAILDLGLGGMKEFREYLVEEIHDAYRVNRILAREVEEFDIPGGDGSDGDGGDGPARAPTYNMFFFGGEGGDAEASPTATIEEGAVDVDIGGGGAGGDGDGYDGDPTARGGDAAASDVEVEGTDTTPIGEGLKAIAAALDDDEDDGDDREEDYDASLSMSIDITNSDDASVVDDPYQPQYNVTVEASEGSDISAAEYLREEMDRFDRLVVGGLNHAAGALEYNLEEDVDTLLEDDLTSVGGNSVTFQAVNRYGDWAIDDAGGYSLTAGLVDLDADTPFDNLRSKPETFGVEGPEEDTVEGWTVSVATQPDEDDDGNPTMRAQDLSESSSVTQDIADMLGMGTGTIDSVFGTLNSTAEPGFNVYVHYDGDSDVDEERYLTNDMDEIVVKWMETGHTVEGDDLPASIGPDPSGTVQKTAVLDTYDPDAGVLLGEVYDGGDTTAAPVDAIETAVDIRGNGVIRLEDPLPYEVPDGGRWDVGAELHHADGSLGGREWGGFDIDRYSRTDAIRDFVTAFSYANHAGQMPDEEDEEGSSLEERIAEYRDQHGGITGAIDDFFEMSPSHISDEMTSRFLGTIPPFNMIPGVRE